MAARLLKRLENIQYGTLDLHLPDGTRHHFQGTNPGPNADMQIDKWRVIFNMWMRGDVGLAWDYRNGHWETTDLPAILTFGMMNRDILQDFVDANFLSRIKEQILYLFRRNSVRQSRRNIHAHYDLGNDFYRLWLDSGLTYSSGLFGEDIPHNPLGLAQAQNAKYDRILTQLGQPEGALLEVGCGWGGFAERAIEQGHRDIKGLTLSTEQQEYAQSRLGERVDIRLEDYRHHKGTYKNIVSIEMFEAVGEEYWSDYFQMIKSNLAQNGMAVIQTITIDDALFGNYRNRTDFIRSFIFPGGLLPSFPAFRKAAKQAGLKIVDHFSFGADYARTLLIWLKTFDAKKEDIMALGYDEKFIRLWRFYLAGCAAGFKSGQTDVMQISIKHA